MSWFPWKKTGKQFNLTNSYLVVEFLTEQEKIKKDKIIANLEAEYQDNLDTIVPYASSFQYSFRYTLNSNTVKGKILLTQVMALLQANNDPDLAEFYETNVNKIKLHMKDNKLINYDDVLELYNQRDVSLYNPSEVLEVIYDRRGLLQRMKVKGKKFVKNLPKTLFNVLTKFLSIILRFMGLGSAGSLVTKFFPFKIALQWILNFLMVFFPALAPLIGLGKLVI